MRYGYIKYDTNEDEINGKIKKLLAESGIDEENIFIEHDNINKIRLNELLDNARENDIIVAPDILDVASTTKQICEIVQQAHKKHFKLILGTFVLDCINEDLKTAGILEMANLFSTFERKIINNRIKTSVNKAKDNGKRIGRPRITLDTLPAKVKETYKIYESGGIGKTEYAQICGISRPLISKYIKLIEEEMGKDHEESF